MNPLRWWRHRQHTALLRQHARWTAETIAKIAEHDPALGLVLFDRCRAMALDGYRDGRLGSALLEITDLLLAHVQEIEDAMEAGEEIVHA